MAVLTGYFDASGKKEHSNVTLAGYIATEEQWGVFGEEWERAMRDWHIPYFHMSEFESYKRIYKYWTRTQHQERYARLLDIINRNVQLSVATSILASEYASVKAPREKNRVGGMYGLAATGCFIETANYVCEADNASAWLAYIFESGDEGAGQIQQAFSLNERNPTLKEKYRLLSFRLENKRQFAPLQAADILAYEIFKHLPRQIGIDDHLARDYPTGRLIEVPRRWIYPTSELMRYALGIDAI